ncbi:MAG: hypothetical protein WCP22_10170 [Chlamydiota bacterium]
MRKMMYAGASVLVAALVCGCAMFRTEKLKVGMSEQQVNDLFGAPKAVYSEKAGGSFVQVIDYSKETMGIPNYLDDYGWIKYPTTHVVRAWFIDGKLTEWCGGKYKSYEALKHLEMKCELRVPPSFNSPSTPAAVKTLQSKGK